MEADLYVEIDSFRDEEYLGIRDQIIAEWLFYDIAYGIFFEEEYYNPRGENLFRMKIQHFNTEKELRRKLCQNLKEHSLKNN